MKIDTTKAHITVTKNHEQDILDHKVFSLTHLIQNSCSPFHFPEGFIHKGHRKKETGRRGMNKNWTVWDRDERYSSQRQIPRCLLLIFCSF